MRQLSDFFFRGARWVFAAAFATACAVVMAQPGNGLSPEAAAVFNRWVQSTCIGDEERQLVIDLRRYADQLSVAFRKAIVDGPPAAEMRAVRVAAEARFAERAKFPIQEYRIEGVSEKDLAAFSRVSRQAYVDDQVRRFATGYRANAVAGLGIVGGPGSRELLARIGNSRSDPLAAAAREAIKATNQ
jgi:hypothetical protein